MVLPPELLDYILDFLHDEPEALKQCCLVSKSWVPRSRRYLFADIGFYSARTLELWNNTFPDPTNTPASHVTTLAVDCYPEDVEGADWIKTFSCVVQLRLQGHPILPFALFHGLSHNLKSLCVRYIRFSCLELFDFICSFPLLENLTLVGDDVMEDNGNDFHGLQSSPPLTGFLKLIVFGKIGSVPRHFLSLPNGLRFRGLAFVLAVENDLRWIRELVFKCSDTLECLDVKYKRFGTLDPIDLSKATKLKKLIFRLKALAPGRVVATLLTITPEHQDLRQFSIYLPYKRIPRGDAAQLRFYLGAGTYQKWLELDCLLVQFWESHSIRLKVVITNSPWRGSQEMKDPIGCLFPEMTARGIIDLVEE